VLVPGADGVVVAAVQEALAAAGVELAGGTDGVYGNDTMAAVAEYQRRNDGLQVTGAVDIATARSLGVYADPDEAGAATTTLPPTTTAATAAVGATPAAVATTPPATTVVPVGIAASTEGGGRPTRWLLAGAAAAMVAASAVVLRARRVAAGRSARRWGRVHPASSPRRSVADMRRAGELPAQPPVATPVIYDREREAELEVPVPD
jgi:hypothetical protein